ncbi:MAG: sporulation protein [Methylotenera sp. 24-45-7]|jgi:cell division protein FtsN|nr:MAG: sporulation protein [Methylotenera sp. 24-45-7]OZA07570.1 MAG: sporulation protein [Methylotenera sp. 17-45-7]HQS44698.1 SPOR domain-containing protein [Methylotenera sp.]
MSRDYKPNPERAKSSSKGSPFFSGLLVGVLLGVGASLAVVMYIKGGETTFSDFSNNKKPVAEKIAEDAKKAAELENSQLPNAADAQDEKAKFDFYTILPGSESKVSTDDVKIKDEQPQPVVQYTYYLQVGAFQTEEEADNMKAKLALQGFEALVQTATIPDKGVWHRVRVGPLNSLDEINKAKNDLVANGFKTDLIKVNNENQ